LASGSDGLRVLEIAGARAGALTAKWFCDLGATVTKLAPLGSGRHPAPIRADALHDIGKRIRAVDLDSAAGVEDLQRCLEWADVSIESAAPGPLAPRPEPAAHDALVRVLISPLGCGGPLASFRSNEFTDEALAGHLALNGEPGRAPIARPGRLSSTQAGLHALIGALAALRVRDATGRGQTVAISHLDGLIALHQHTLTMWTHDRHVLARSGNRQPGYWHPAGLYRCLDGHVALHVGGQAVRDRLLVATGLEHALLDPRFNDDLALARHKDEFDALLEPWLRARTAAEIVAQLQGVRVPAGRVIGAREVLDDPQLEAMAGLARVGDGHVPRAALRIEEHAVEPTAARRLEGSAHTATIERPRTAHAAGDFADGPLAGVRVLDLGRMWAGPLAGRLLADLGADVVAVESPGARGARRVPPELAAITHLFPDGELGDEPWNRIGSVNALARNKRAITLDLGRSDARHVFEQLVAHADVVLENFHPDFLPRLGLDFEHLLAFNPRLIFASITGFGAKGPDAGHLAFGPIIEARCGVAHAMGERGGPPLRSGIAWPDPLAALHAVAAIVAALRDRDRDRVPRARRVEISLLGSALAICDELLVDAQRDDADPPRQGARDPRHAPQGVYPCAGDDRWIAISVTDDAEWHALARCLDLDAGLAALDRATRQARHEEIDAAIARATLRDDRIALTHRLQQVGVLAAWLSDARDLCENTELDTQGFWFGGTQACGTSRREAGAVIRFDATPCQFRRSAPRLGEHNAEVLREWLGFDRVAIDELVGLGVLVETPPD
jgi:crotonobetainyl-CoA:carnitine CoA-transferase CaiB-like acyl-CoA transferase